MTNDKTVEEILEAAQCNPDHIVFAKEDLDTYYRKKFAEELFKKLENSSKYLEYGNTSLGEMYIRVDDIKKVLCE